MKLKNKEKQSVSSCKVHDAVETHDTKVVLSLSFFPCDFFLGGVEPGMGEKGNEQSKNMQLHNHNNTLR